MKSNDHPTSGGSDYYYSLSLSEQPVTEDVVLPDLTMVYPTLQDGVPSGPTAFSAHSDDIDSGVNRIEFWWHSPDWVSGKWQLLASDTYPGDGWGAPFDGSSYFEGQSGALDVISFDNEGNARSIVQWDVTIDDTPPVTSLNSLPAMSDGTGFQLSWNASDTRSRLGGYDIQFQMDDGNWQEWLTDISGSQRSAWFIGQPGHVYGFRMRGRDTAGNLETFPSGAEVTTQVSPSCTVDLYDQGEGDGQATSAAALPLDELQPHNFCGPGDIDWVGFFAQAGQTYLIWVLPDNVNPAGSAFDLYQSNEGGWLLHGQATNLIAPLSVKWLAPADGLYLLRIVPVLEGISGNNTVYWIRIGSGWWFNFPVVYK